MTVVSSIAVKWLINDWYKKSQEVEEVRKRRISRIEGAQADLQKTINSLKDTIISHARKLGRSEAAMASFKAEIRNAMDTLDGYKKNLDANVKNEVRTQIIQLTKDLRLVRDKKDG